VRQQNSGAVEDFILPYSAVYLGIQKVKELLKSVHICQSYRKNKSGTFFYGPRCRNGIAT